MKKSRATYVASIVAANILVFALVFGAAEILARWFAPEYVNAYFNDDTTWGHHIYRNSRWPHRVGRDQVDATFARTSADEVRILVVGDSVTFGYGIPYEDSFHQVAGRLLAQAGCRANVHGVGRLHSNLTSLLASEHRAFMLDVFEPNVFIYQFLPNDVGVIFAPKKRDDQLTRRERFEKFRISWLNRSAFLKLVQSASNRLAAQRTPQNLADSIHYSPKSDPDAYERAWQEFEASLVETKQMLASRGIEFHILLSPEAHNVSATPIDNDLGTVTTGITVWPADRVEAIAHRLDIPIVDPLPYLQKYRQEFPLQRLYFPNDATHPNRLGHELMGKPLADYLRSIPGVCQTNGQ